MRPLNVLVVDDEIPLRQELRLFPWAECNALLIGEASNGAEALQLCAAQVPDVVITDITMPVMDGIELTRELRKSYPEVQIILLTCHNEFHYAQEALRLGALEYLLKVSMDDGELKLALDKAREAVARERLTRSNKKSEQRQLQAALFAKLLRGYPTTDSDWLPLALDSEADYVLVRVIIEAPGTTYLAVRQYIQQLLSDREQSDPAWLTWLSVREQEYMILFVPQHINAPLPASLPGILQSLHSQLEREAEGGTLTTIKAIVSDPFHDMIGLIRSLGSSTEWKNALFYDSIAQGSIFTGTPSPMTPLSDKLAKQLDAMLRTTGWSATSLIECLQKEFRDWCRAQRILPEQLKQRMLNWQVNWVKARGGAELDSTSIANLMETQTLEQLITALCSDIEAWENARIRSRVEVRTAVQWIRDNLKEPLSLPVIAEQVGLSPHYVSRLFREETGSSVNEYITQLRMEKAIQLLTQTNMKVYEIAEEVGIPSYRYFTVTFRKWTGVSPTDYKRHS